MAAKDNTAVAGRVSAGELKRRWKAVLEQMRARKLDFLLVQNNKIGERVA
ncbi:hypothetical protein ACFLW1_03215 [Chloroflexota bacterium]